MKLLLDNTFLHRVESILAAEELLYEDIGDISYLSMLILRSDKTVVPVYNDAASERTLQAIHSLKTFGIKISPIVCGKSEFTKIWKDAAKYVEQELEFASAEMMEKIGKAADPTTRPKNIIKRSYVLISGGKKTNYHKLLEQGVAGSFEYMLNINGQSLQKRIISICGSKLTTNQSAFLTLLCRSAANQILAKLGGYVYAPAPSRVRFEKLLNNAFLNWVAQQELPVEEVFRIIRGRAKRQNLLISTAS